MKRLPGAPYLGLGLTLLACLLVEAALRLGAPAPVPTVLLIVALLPVAYTGLQAGAIPGLASALLLALYTLHFLSPDGYTPTGTATQGFAIMLLVGIAMALPMALVKRREDRLRHDLEERARELERRNDELTEANAALEAFGYVVSHDLKEPVRAIANYLDAAQESYGTEDGQADLARAADANRRLVRLLNGLLSYARASSLAATPRPLDVREVLDSDACRAQYDTLLRERRGRLQVEPSLPAVLGDEVILTQLLGNVVLNAVRHNPRPNPMVRVRALPDAPPGRVHLVVEDNGEGFPADVLQRFETLRASRPTTLRSGFGLAISHRAAQRLDGRLWLANGPGGGEVHLQLLAGEASSVPVAAPAELPKYSR